MDNDSVQTPLSYLLKYIPNRFFEEKVTYTNMYALQNITTSNATTIAEIKSFFSLSIIAGFTHLNVLG